GVVLQRGTPGEAVGDAIGFRWTPPAAALPAGASIAFSVVTPRDAAQRLSARLGVRLDENGNFMPLELDGTDPKSIAGTLNAIARVLGQAPESGVAVAGLEVIGTAHNSRDLVEALKELTAKQAERRALRYRYTDEHPPVKRLQASIETLERHTIPALAGALLEEVGTRERVLDSLVQSGGRELQQIPLRAVEEARL